MRKKLKMKENKKKKTILKMKEEIKIAKKRRKTILNLE